jgi:predicted O-linked N-acetylglucosamine transferase (SPINDLY family)
MTNNHDLGLLIDLAVEKHREGKLAEAESLYRQILQQQPDNARVLQYLGNLFQEQARFSEAIAVYQQVRQLQPEADVAAGSQFCLGKIYEQQYQFEEATHAYEQVLKLQPGLALAYQNLGYVWQNQGKLTQATYAYQQAIELDPNLATAYQNLAVILPLQNRGAEAVKYFQQAIKLDPNLLLAYDNLGKVLHQQGDDRAGIQAYEQGLQVAPDRLELHLGRCISQLAVIYKNAAEIESSRQNYQKNLQVLAQYCQQASKKTLKATAIGSSQPFFLAYQGKNDRQLQQIYGEMVCSVMAKSYPQWSKSLPKPQLAADEKIRIGFVSAFFRNHSNWKMPLQGWVEQLDRSRFEIFGYHVSSTCNWETAKAIRACDKFLQGPLNFEQWLETISQDRLHAIVFPEFGMDALTLQLGALRLAPVQLTSWGHPETSGMPTIDYFLSSDLMEPDNADEHYTEKLVRLPNLSIYYQPRSIPPQAIARKFIGLSQDDIVFWCCQSLYKYLPQHDDVFPKIAQELPNAKFVFIKYSLGDGVNEIFQERLRGAFAEYGLDYQKYCIFLPFLSEVEFAGMCAIADVFLDSIGWSGCNSVLESLAHDLPVVTLSGELMRGRHALAILKQLDITETIAANKDEYVQIAIRLGREPGYRQQLAHRISINKHKLYYDLEPIYGLEKFLCSLFGQDCPTPSQRVSRTVPDINSLTIAPEKLNEALKLALEHQQAKRPQQAEQIYYAILERYPDCLDALYGLGILASSRGEYDFAELLLRLVLRLQPETAKAWFSLGNLERNCGDLVEAIGCYQRALDIQPRSIASWNNLGQALEQQGDLDGAIACYRQILEQQSNSLEADVNLGNALFAQGKLDRDARERYAQLNQQLGKKLRQQGILGAASDCYRQAIALQPELIEAYEELGLVLQQQGDIDGAIAIYQQALTCNNEFSHIYFRLGQIYQTQEQFDRASEFYRQGLCRANSHYAEALKSDGDCAPSELVPPPPPSEEVVFAEHKFPAIPPVTGQKRPFWSVVIPTYNRPQFILECLASVLAQWQGEEQMEILVVDNGSDRPIGDLVDSIGKGIVTYYRRPAHIPLPANWNSAVSLCRGEWIHLLHDDDYVLPGFYDRLQQSLQKCSSQVGAAFTGYENINENREIIFRQQLYGNYRGIVHDWLWHIGVSNPLSPPSVVIRRSVYEHVGGYNQEFIYTTDWELYMRIATVYDWWCEPELLAHYRQHALNVTTELNRAGTQGTAIRHAIELSQSYLPEDIGAEITRRSRHHFFNWCLDRMTVPVKAGNLTGALCLLQEALKIDNSVETRARLFTWLATKEAAPLSQEISAKLLEISLQDTRQNYQFAAP